MQPIFIAFIPAKFGSFAFISLVFIFTIIGIFILFGLEIPKLSKLKREESETQQPGEGMV
jgi:hypothetical protein